MAKHLTVALLISGLVFLTGTADAGQKKHAHPVKHDMHKVNQAHHNVHKDHQALKHDYSQQHQARQNLQADWKQNASRQGIRQHGPVTEGQTAIPAGPATVPSGSHSNRSRPGTVVGGPPRIAA